MLGIANSQTLRTVNFIVGLALLVMLFPKHGNLPEKPAGVRTAVELVSKKDRASYRRPRSGFRLKTFDYSAKIKHVVVACASNLPCASVRRPSAVAARRPRESNVPSARTGPVSFVTGRNSEILNSIVV